jgi:hypothetical protein
MCENRFEQQVLLQSHVLLTFKVVRHYFKKAVIDLPMCTATYTPQFGGGKKHWSVNCSGFATNEIVSQYAKGIGKSNIVLNPNWLNEPSERRLP